MDLVTLGAGDEIIPSARKTHPQGGERLDGIEQGCLADDPLADGGLVLLSHKSAQSSAFKDDML